MKGKRIGKKDANTKTTQRCVIEKETEVLGVKPLRLPSSNRSTRQLVGIHRLAKDPPSLIYPLYLSSPSSYSNKTSRNRVLSSSPDLAIHSIVSAKPHRLLLAIPQSFPNSKNTPYILKRCGLCLGTNFLSRYDNVKGKEKRL